MIEQVTPTNVNLDDLEFLIESLSAEELEELAECDPDDSSMPPSMRCAYNCKKDATEWVGDSNRDQLNLVLKEQALALPDKEEHLKWEPGAKRGKVWVPRQSEQETLTKEYSSDEEDNVDKEESLEELDSEYTAALQLAAAT